MANSAWKVEWDVMQRMKTRHFWRPRELARELGYTRAEVELALCLLRKEKIAAYRSFDGRWFLISSSEATR